MNRSRAIPTMLACLTLVGLLFFAGCATAPKPIPMALRSGEHNLMIDITKIKDKGTFRDSGQGGLIGAMVGMSRQSDLRKKLEGIEGGTVKEVLKKELSRQLEEHFFIGDAADDLVLQVEVTQWGWFLPTTVLGIKTGSYQFEIIGRLRMFDRKSAKPQDAAADVTITAQEPIGDNPDATRMQEIFLKVSDKFAKQAVDFMLGRTPQK